MYGVCTGLGDGDAVLGDLGEVQDGLAADTRVVEADLIKIEMVREREIDR